MQPKATSFNQAEATCQAFGSSTHSVSIQSEGENQFVNSLQGTQNIWTGGFRSPQEEFGKQPWTGLWRWTDESKWIYDSWKSRREAYTNSLDLRREPNNYYYTSEYWVWKAPSGGCAGGCTGSWNDGLEQKPGDAVAPYPLCKYIPKQSIERQSQCKIGWTLFQEYFCYQLQPDAIQPTFDAAEAACNAYGRGTHSVSIHSHEENEFVTSLQGEDNIWTGGFRQPMNGGIKPWVGLWEWSDGTQWKYDAWNSGELNNHYYGAEYWVWKGPGNSSWADSLNGFYPPHPIKALCKYEMIFSHI